MGIKAVCMGQGFLCPMFIYSFQTDPSNQIKILMFLILFSGGFDSGLDMILKGNL